MTTVSVIKFYVIDVTLIQFFVKRKAQTNQITTSKYNFMLFLSLQEVIAAEFLN